MNIKKITKKDGTIMYRTSVYLGIESLGGKQVRTSVKEKPTKL